MKVTIPEELKKDMPQTTWGKILSATPIVMTVIATLLAGLASSEMTRAQYDRALGAQLQSKAGDQWGYFQAKKLRGAMQRNSLELLQATTDVHPLENPALEKIPSVAAPALDANLQTALEAVETEKPETEIAGDLKAVDDKTLAAALQAARDQARDFDAALAPANQAIAQLEKSLPAGDKSAARNLTAAKMRFSGHALRCRSRLEPEHRLSAGTPGPQGEPLGGATPPAQPEIFLWHARRAGWHHRFHLRHGRAATQSALDPRGRRRHRRRRLCHLRLPAGIVRRRKRRDGLRVG